MKSLLFSLLLIICSFATYSQVEFEKGYYIDNNGSRIEGLIKNKDWDVNPLEFVFRQSEDAANQRITIEDAKEFAISSISRFVRAEVDIDFSSTNLNELSQSRAPEFRREKVFLKVVVQGKATLYSYLRKNQTWYFLETDKVPVQQLINKQYMYNASNAKDRGIAKNQSFRQQLIAAFECNTPQRSVLENAQYKQRELTKLFHEYNACMQVESVDYNNKIKHDVFNIWIRPRMNITSISSKTYNFPSHDIPFETQMKFSAGLELEFILPFNKNKWAFTIEPNYTSYDATSPSHNKPYSINYSSFDVPVGVRHYFFLNEYSKISLGASYQMNLAGSSTFTDYNEHVYELPNTFNFALEGGYVFKNKFCVAYRYQTKRNVLVHDTVNGQPYEASIGTMSIVVGYSPF